jgi:hypothetical protein
MKTKLKLWLRRLVIRQAIRLVDAIESQCFTWQTSLRAKLVPQECPRVAGPAETVSDFRLAWRVTKVLFLLLGVLGFVSFFATLHAFYFLAFAFLTLSGWTAVFVIVKKFAAPASGRRAPAVVPSVAPAGEILADDALRLGESTEAQLTPPPGSVVCASAARRDFSQWQTRRDGLRPIVKPRKHRQRISSAEFNRRLAGEMEKIFGS